MAYFYQYPKKQLNEAFKKFDSDELSYGTTGIGNLSNWSYIEFPFALELLYAYISRMKYLTVNKYIE